VLRLRFLSAFFGVPVLLGVTIAGGWWYVAAVVVGVVLASFEIFSMLLGAGFRPLRPLGLALAIGIVLAALTPDARIMAAIVVVAMLVGLGQMMLRPEQDGTLVDWALTLAGATYVGGTMHYFVALRWLPDGLLWMLLVLICTWVCDITAFFVGRRWGNARLAPRISPGKSVEGAAGGLVGAVLAAFLLGPFLVGIMVSLGLTVVGPFTTGPLGGLRLAGLGLVIGVCGIAGDLMESFVKRQCGAKDSGTLIPGHGGALDRIDSVLVAAVGAYFFVVTTA
jgi:phosphatidate cytidylyltransferase